MKLWAIITVIYTCIASSMSGLGTGYELKIKDIINVNREDFGLESVYYDYSLHEKLQRYPTSELKRNGHVIEMDGIFGSKRPMFLVEGLTDVSNGPRKVIKEYFNQIEPCLDLTRCSNSSFSHFVSCVKPGIDIHSGKCDMAPFRSPVLLIKSLESIVMTQRPIGKGIGKFWIYGTYKRKGLDMLLETDEFLSS